jgi:hypothetical protein
MERMLGLGFLLEGVQPRASSQGTLICPILTLPDSVRRRPMLFQLCWGALVGDMVVKRWMEGTYCKFDTRLVCMDKSKNVIFSSF